MKPYKEVLRQAARYLSLNAGPRKAVFALVVVEDLIETMASQTASAIVLILGTHIALGSLWCLHIIWCFETCGLLYERTFGCIPVFSFFPFSITHAVGELDY